MAPSEKPAPDPSQKTMFAFFSKKPAAPKVAAKPSSSTPNAASNSKPVTSSASVTVPASTAASTSKPTSSNKSSPAPTSDGDSLLAPVTGMNSSHTSDAIDLDGDDDDDGPMPSPKRASKGKGKRRVIESDESDDDGDAVAAPRKSLKPKASTSSLKQPAKKKARQSVGSDDENDEDNSMAIDIDDDASVASFASSSASVDKKAVTKKSTAPRPKPKPVQKKLASGGKSDASEGSRSSLPQSSKSKAKGKDKEQTKQSKHDEAFAFVTNRKDADGRTEDDPEFDPRTILISRKEFDNLSDMEQQFWDIKRNNMDVILFFQKGKFFELYEEDARVAHQLFDLKLTDRIKMCMVGVPESSFEVWAQKFLSRGYKVGRVEQTETALGAEMRNKSKSKPKIVNRVLKYIMTQATQVDNLEDDQARHCISIKETHNKSNKPVIGLCILDAATAEFQFTCFIDDESRTRLETTLRQLRPLELLFEKSATGTGLSRDTLRVLKMVLSPDCLWTNLRPGEQMCDAEEALRRLRIVLNRKVKVTDDDDAAAAADDEEEDDDDVMNVDADETELPPVIERFRNSEEVMSAFGGLLWYLRGARLETELVTARNFRVFDPTRDGGVLALDGQTLAHIEVLEGSNGGPEGSLLKMLNRCTTPYGRRLFKQWLCAPLRSAKDINARLDTVEDLIKSREFVQLFEKTTKGMPDLERQIARIHAGGLKPRDFVRCLKAFGKIGTMLVALSASTNAFKSDDIPNRLKAVPDIDPLVEKLEAMYSYDKDNDKVNPLEGADEAYDAAAESITDAETALQELLGKYKKELGSKAVCFKDVGTKEIYQIEVPIDVEVPDSWRKVSGTKKVHRYYSPKVEKQVRALKEGREHLEAAIKGFKGVLFAAFDEHFKTWLRVVKTVAELDCLISLAKASEGLGEPACRPEIVESDVAFVDFEELRHPCILVDSFISNDVAIGGPEQKNVVLLTGPNMAGKSTLLRMTCVAVIMAQLGMFVPATRARIAPCDRINTRMGANDAIFAGSSTFKVELDDCQKILKEATPKSLVILDELGRGTSTWDGMAIAYAVLHHLATHAGCLTMFSTHYSALVEDTAYHPQIRPMHMLIQEDDEESHLVVFLYKLADGAAKGSFGPSVAKLAGLSSEIVNRAVSISRDMQKSARARELELRGKEPIPLAVQSDIAWLHRAWRDDKLPDVVDKQQLLRTLDVVARSFEVVDEQRGENAMVVDKQ